MSRWKPGTEFDGYRLVRSLGKGAMGEVMLAHDTLLDRPVAVKLVTTAETDPRFRDRFAVEARAIARLQHPNVVAVHRIGELEGVPYLVSEYVEGEPLDSVELPLEERRVLRIAAGLAGALSMAHRRGVLHRDIKPANVILDVHGEAKLLDFGIAKLLSESPAPETEQGPGAAAPRETAHAESTAIVSTHEGASASSPDLTRAGATLGTPAYMAPEIWLGRPASPRSDVYSFGALLFALGSGSPPHAGLSIEQLARVVPRRPPPPAADAAPAISPELGAVIDRCLDLDPADRFSDGEELRAAISELTLRRHEGVLPGGNPYRGLNAFDAEHSGLFFGRDSEIRMVLDRLANEPMVLVVGDSGVGKSSLVRAGVLPRMDGWVEPPRRWKTAIAVPGRHPIAGLAAPLAALAGEPEREVERLLEEEPAGVGRWLRARLEDRNGAVLLLDQLEELVTLSVAEEAHLAAEALHWLAVPAPGIRVLGTVRGDFLGRLAELGPLGDDLGRALYFLRPLNEQRMRDAVVGPALAKGTSFESRELVGELVSSATSSRGGLPLLQFALAELWEVRRPGERTISKMALERIGGVEGALAGHADDVLSRLFSQEREAARRLLLRLVGPDGTRVRLSDAELGTDESASARRALDSLVRGRLVVARESEGLPAYEIAHESLVKGWPTLAGWLTRDAESRLARDRLRRAAADWERLGRGREGLFGAARLREVERVDPATLSKAERAFLSRSRRARHRRRWAAIGAAAVLCALIAGVYLGMEAAARAERREEVRLAVDEAERRVELAEKLDLEARAARERALRLFDEPEPDAAERDWKEYRKLEARARAAFAEASRRLETALLLAPERRRTREELADVILARALAAERGEDERAVEELLGRLALYDEDGGRIAAWNAPGRLTLTVEPQDAEIEIQRYVRRSEGRWSLEPVSARIRPRAGTELPPGSYLARLSAPGRSSVRMPFALRRDGETKIEISLPEADLVPDGFVFVPAGELLFGSGAPDSQRRDFFHTVPIHPRRTGAFLVARRETTFADWLRYLESLPPSRREERMPRVGAGGFQGALGLRRLEDGRYELTLEPSSERFRAESGEKIRFPARQRRAIQDWLLFPVAGITAADAEAYASWLDETGRVPGARLCSELEWERAARGADDRRYPHGDTLSGDEANYDDTYGKKPGAIGPDEVGSHPASRSPFGLDDMAGNAWEWTRSVLEEDGFVARGGSYYYGENSCQVAERAVTEPSFRDASVGFRICADLRREDVDRHDLEPRPEDRGNYVMADKPCGLSYGRSFPFLVSPPGLARSASLPWGSPCGPNVHRRHLRLHRRPRRPRGGVPAPAPPFRVCDTPKRGWRK
ncbi:MAG: SUMF1/EgtB/PvdO family nonheme iron enzyme [Polyangia bacterium]